MTAALAEAARRLVARRADRGLSPRISDPVILGTVAAVLRAETTKVPPGVDPRAVRRPGLQSQAPRTKPMCAAGREQA